MLATSRAKPLQRVLWGIAVLPAFLAALVLGTSLHLNVPVARRVLSRFVNDGLREAVAGTVTIGRIDRLGPGSLTLADVRIAEPDGTEVLTIKRLELDGPGWLGLRSLWAKAPGLVVRRLAITEANLELGIDDAGQLGIARALKERVGPVAPTAAPPSKGFALRIERFEFDRVRIHGTPGTSHPLDGAVTAVVGSLDLAPTGLQLAVEHAEFAAPNCVPAPLQGSLKLGLQAPRDASGTEFLAPTLSSDVDATFGVLQLRVHAEIRDETLTISAISPSVGQDELAVLLPELPLRPPRPIALELHLKKTGGALQATARATLPARNERTFPSGPALLGNVEVEGRYEPTSGNVAVEVTASEFDIATLAPSLGQSRIDVRGSARLNTRARVVHGAVHVSASELAMADGKVLAFPAASGSFSASASGSEVRLSFDEPGSPSEGRFLIGADRAVEFALHALIPALDSVPRLKALAPDLPAVRGKSELTAGGHLANGVIDAFAHARVQTLSIPQRGLRLERGELDSHVFGPLDALQLDASARGESLGILGKKFPKFTLRATGSRLRTRVRAEVLDDAQRTWKAAGFLEPAQKTVKDVSIELSRIGTYAHGHINAVSLGPRDEVKLAELSLGGGDVGGTLKGQLSLVGGDVEGQLEGEGIQLQALSKLFALGESLQGTLDIDIDTLRNGPVGQAGYAEVRLHNAGTGTVEGVNGTISVDFEGHHVSPHAEFEWRGAQSTSSCAKGVLSAALGGHILLDGPLLQPSTWSGATGQLELQESTIDLDCLSPFLQLWVPHDRQPVGKLGGKVELELVAERRTPTDKFALTGVEVLTHGLQVAAPADDAGKVAWRSDHLDLRLKAHADATTGAFTLDANLLDATLRHATTPLGTVHLETTLQPSWLSDPPPLAMVALGLATKPFAARLEVRDLAERDRRALPSPWREQLASVGGSLSIIARAGGTALAPEGAFRAMIRGLEAKEATLDRGIPRVDVEAIGTYRENLGRVSAWVELPVPGGSAHTIASLDAQLEKAPLRLFGPAQRPRIAATARINRLPLGAIGALSQRGLQGNLSGRVAFRDNGAEARLDARLSGSEMRFGGIDFDEVGLDLGPRENGRASEVQAEARLRAHNGGSIILRGSSSLRWNDGVPALDLTLPGALAAEAMAFPLRVLQPFLPKEITRVDGRLDGRLSASFRELTENAVVLSGALSVTDGILQAPNFGQELSNLGASITARPGILSVHDLHATTPTGKVTGRLDARFAGLRLIDFTGQFVVPADNELPLALQGQPIGTLRGVVTLRGEQREAEHLDVDVTAAGLQFRLPLSPNLGSTRLAPQELAPHPDVVLLQPLVPSEVSKQKPGFIAVNVVLKDATVEGSALKLTLSTEADHPIRMDGAADVSGELVFGAGFLKLMGKTFELDRGVVRLRSEEPTNPYVNMTAHWNVPDGTVVFVDFIGNVKPLTREKLRFRSNPPRNEDAILALLLFGDTYDLNGTAVSDAQRRANQALGGALVAELNQLFGEALPGLSAGIGAAAQGYTATTVSYQFSDRLSAQAVVEQAPGTGPLGVLGPSSDSGGTSTNQGVNNGDARTKLGVDWRFADRWLMRGSVGVSGGAASGVDLLYQRRY